MKIYDKKRLDSAYKLLDQSSTTLDKFESISSLINGINPKIDRLLSECLRSIKSINDIQDGKLIDLTVENLPEKTEKEKKRKKLLLLLIKNWGELKSEIKRVSVEMENSAQQGKLQTSAKIGLGAKGVFGLITFAAVVIVGFGLFSGANSTPQKSENKLDLENQKSRPVTKVIEFNGKKIPLGEVEERSGPDCDSPHYHALDHTAVKAFDGSVVQDPGGCGFGRVKEVKILEIQ